MLVWVVAFIIMDIGGRAKWAERDRREGQVGGAGANSDGLQNDGRSDADHNNTATSPGAASTAQPSTFIADTIVSLIVVIATFLVMALCKCAVKA